MEPTYATVKRTARTPSQRSDNNCGHNTIYREYPCTINGTTGLVTIATEGAAASTCCGETDSCLSYDAGNNLGVCSNNGVGQAAFLRLHDVNEHLLSSHHY